MKLRIAARKSDLARLQATWVAQKIERLCQSRGQELEIEFFFSESLGDKNQNDPLWKMPEKGVFTSDLSMGLEQGRYDLVVHSWKDLPLESDSQVLGCPGRVDSRDVILFRRDAITLWQKSHELVVLSSSPRRERNLSGFLTTHLPKAPESVRFVPVRGNIPTRIKKLLDAESGAHALVIAKAALERLLSPPTTEFAGVANQIKEMLSHTLRVVAPLSINPPAPAQGALALEIRPNDPQVKALLLPLIDQNETESVRDERLELAQHGGGCHQKIGVSVSQTGWGKLKIVRGLTQNGVVLDRRSLEPRSGRETKILDPSCAWSTALLEISLFDREPKPVTQDLSALPGWYISHPEALPAAYGPERAPEHIWCSGLSTWKKLCERGFWVEGCDDSLGETESTESRSTGYTKLSHQDSPELSSGIATYRLVPRAVSDPPSDWQIRGKTHFFWKSISQFLRVSQLCPEILKHKHACGMGFTARYLSAHVESLEVFLDEADWRRNYGL